MKRAIGLLSGCALLLTACGGGGSGGSAVVIPSPAPSPTPAPTGTCSLASRQNWALATLREWYLFPDLLAGGVNTASYTSVDDYIDALTAPARAQSKDRFFTYLTSIAEENAFFSSGASAGFGIRISYDTAARRVFVAEVFETAPAFAAGLDRGDEIIAVGTNAGDLRPVSDIIAASGTTGVVDALGPANAGVARLLRLSRNGATRDVMVTKADYDLSPLSSRYGATVLNVDGHQIGYLNLRTFITSAEPQLRQAFGQFRAQGISEFIIDLRYNGGGLVDVADLIGDLLGGARSRSEVWERTTYRPEKSSNDSVHRFSPGAQSVTPVKIAFIGTAATASASEIVINGTVPYLGNNVSLIGANSYGKPVGQIAVDRAQCDDRLRVVAFAVSNATGNGAYFTGLAASMPNTCQAADDVAFPLGDAREAMVKGAVDFLVGRACTAGPIATGASASSLSANGGGPMALLHSREPTAAQLEVPGLF